MSNKTPTRLLPPEGGMLAEALDYESVRPNLEALGLGRPTGERVAKSVLGPFEMDGRVSNLETAALLLHETELSSLSRTILRRIAEYRVDLQERDKVESEMKKNTPV